MTMIDLALLIVRIVLGVIFILHGGQKLFGWYEGPGMKGFTGWMSSSGIPPFLARLAAFSEFGGGLLILFGLLTPLAAALVISSMVVAIAEVHAKSGFFNTEGGYEFNLSLITLALVLLLAGAGAISMDALLGWAMPLDQLPLWAVVVLVLIPFGGILLVELTRQAAPEVDTGQNNER